MSWVGEQLQFAFFSFSGKLKTKNKKGKSKMGNKYSRSGGKFSGNHTTLIPAACTVADIASACSQVRNISPGYIKAGLNSVSGDRRVKITDIPGGLFLSVRDNTSHQELYVYADDIQATRTAIARGARNCRLNISFGKR